ncbi:MAG: tetrahydromethanopterin S-methyltransferase subunit A [Thermoplasmata archaeon]|nr:tetrahydromethanopterin S-methyltransferase subunit A [Thermoplasmata archaeon]
MLIFDRERTGGINIYPWRGEFTVGNPESPIAISTLASQMKFPEGKVAIWGHMKTENLGIEKVVANVISNPLLRVLIVCGEEVRGHRSGHSLLSLYKNGFDENGRIVGAKGAVPFMENIDMAAVQRFQEQVEIIDMIDITDKEKIMEMVDEQLTRDLPSFGEPYIVEIMNGSGGERPSMKRLTGKIGFHKDLIFDPFLEFEEMAVEESV